MTNFRPQSKFDLVLERVVELPKRLVWDAWTRPEHIVHWFTPAPWKTVEADIDLRPGGAFEFTMQSPEGQKFPNVGCVLEVVHEERLVWTSALHAGYRPAPRAEGAHALLFTAAIMLESHGTGTKYTAIAIHPDEKTSKQHSDMGFQEGWGKALDQLVAYMRSRR